MGISQSNRHRRTRGERAAAEETFGVSFDPADATVASVLAYVDEHPETRDAVLAAEQAGKARKGIIDALS